jgi:membrane fusion protein, multidrug efflux system
MTRAPVAPCTLTLIAFAAALLAGCSHEVATDDALPMTAGLLALPTADANPVEPVLASVLYSERDAEMRARARGVVIEVIAELGDPVEAGQILARLDDGEQRAALAVAEATLELARLEHGRIMALREADVIEPAEADRATYRLRTAEAERDRASALLEYTRIRAPFDGVVARRFIRLGEMVDEGSPLFRVTAPRPLRVRIMVPEDRALALRVGQQARLLGAAGVAPATIARISPAVDPASGSLEALLDVPRPGPLRPGSAVRVEWDGAASNERPDPR